MSGLDLAASVSEGSVSQGAFGLNPWAALLLAVFLVFINGFFVAAEFALVKVRPTQLQAHVSARGRLAQTLVRKLDTYLSACQLGITLASLGLGWVGEPAFAHLITPLMSKLPFFSPGLVHTVSLVLAFTIITTLHIVVGEMAPKTLAIRKPEATSLQIAYPLHWFNRLTYPIIWLLNSAANGVLRLVGLGPLSEANGTHSEEEVRRLLASREDSELSSEKRELLENVFELSERTARQIMVPRSDVVFLSTSQSIEDSLEKARASGHSRFPLCENDLDHVIGIVHIKDIFQAGDSPPPLTELKRPIYFVPETLAADRLLRKMRLDRAHMIATLDEFGGISGIVTLENVIEEIVGEIQDEFDAEPPEIVELGDGAYRISGSVLVTELEHELGIELSDRDEDTIAGVVLSELGRQAQVDDLVQLTEIELEVKEIDGHRIVTLAVQTRQGEEGEGGEKSEY